MSSVSISSVATEAGGALMRNLVMPLYETCLGGQRVFKLCGNRDGQTIDKINQMIFAKVPMAKIFLERSFERNSAGIPHAREREAANSYWISVFIHESRIASETQELVESLNDDQRWIALAYLAAIDQGQEIAQHKYPKYYKRIERFAQQFLIEADNEERAFYAARNFSIPGTFIEGNQVRPLDGKQRISFGPKVTRHPVTSLMLGEVRRSKLPIAQRHIDGHFHALNLKSRPIEVEKMKKGATTVTQVGSTTVISYAMPVQIEFFPNLKKTTVPAFLNNMPGEESLTTHGLIHRYEFANGKSAYLIAYQNYKTTPTTEKYLVSETIPVGDKGEQYEAELDFDSAHAKVMEFSN